MKKIFLALFALLAVAFNAKADNLVEGQQYKIVTLDGTKALSCGETAQNNVHLKLTALSNEEEGQVWTLYRIGEYWGITSYLGAFNIDNPAKNHTGFNNELCLWKTENSENQRWTFEDAGDGTYYMIPFENAQKCYAEDADGNFTWQDKAADKRVKLVKYEVPPFVLNGITSGKYYRICSPDGKMALSNSGSTANDLVVSMTSTNQSDEGQIWQITHKNGFWQIKSYCGNVCLDNPAEAHGKFHNQLIQWKTSGGENQRWVFEVIGDNYYMIPYQNATAADKCYGYNEDGVFIYQDKGGKNTQLRLIETTPPTCPVAKVEGFYALQSLCVFPDYIYASEGRFVTFADNGASSLAKNYTYAGSRLYVEADEDGQVTMTLPQADNKVVVVDGTTLKASATAAANKFTLFMNTEELNVDTRVALHAGSTVSSPVAATLSLVGADANGSGLKIASTALNNSFAFRLVALPAAEEVEQLKTIIDEAKAINGLSGDDATQLNTAIKQAQSELDYPYLTKQDVVLDVAELQTAIDAAKAVLSGANSSCLNGNVTAIDEAQNNAVRIVAQNHRIVVYNAQNVRIFNAAGQRQQNGVQLPSGAYVVKADGKVVKVVL